MLSMFRRNTFLGRTDSYLTTALAGLAVIDPMRDYFSQHHRDDTVTRLNRYYRNWRFYNSKQWSVDALNGESKFVLNYCRAVADKSCDWLMGRGFTLGVPEGNEAIGTLLNGVWDSNNRMQLGWRLAQMGAVCGDAYVLCVVPWVDAYGRVIPPAQQSVRLQVINPSYVHPRFASSEDRTVTQCLIQYPVERKRYADLVPSKKGSYELAMYSMFIDINEIREFVDDMEIPNSRRPNPFGIVPLIHIQNLPHPGFFGMSDLDDIIPVNEQINTVSESIRKIVEYHAEPTTVIFGAKAGELVRGASKVWSGLPVEARVETLRLDANLVEISAYRDNLKLAIHELSGTPEQSLGKIQPISNTSDAAMQTAYMPLLEKTIRKRITYGQGIQEINRVVLTIIRNYFAYPIERVCGDPGRMLDSTVSWPSPLPQDARELTEIALQRLDHGLDDEADVLRQLHGDENITSRAIRITADRREKLLRDAEATKAAMGTMPNIAVFSTGSIAMIPGVAEAFEAQDKILDVAMRKQAELEAAAAQAQQAGGEPPPEG